VVIVVVNNDISGVEVSPVGIKVYSACVSSIMIYRFSERSGNGHGKKKCKCNHTKVYERN
jgi:hypothetical protein